MDNQLSNLTTRTWQTLILGKKLEILPTSMTSMKTAAVNNIIIKTIKMCKSISTKGVLKARTRKTVIKNGLS